MISLWVSCLRKVAVSFDSKCSSFNTSVDRYDWKILPLNLYSVVPNSWLGLVVESFDALMVNRCQQNYSV